MFRKNAFLIISALLLLLCSIQFVPKHLFVSSGTNEKKLPIYCVDTPEKKNRLELRCCLGE